jgi:hypothetical protein
VVFESPDPANRPVSREPFPDDLYRDRETETSNSVITLPSICVIMLTQTLPSKVVSSLSALTQPNPEPS